MSSGADDRAIEDPCPSCGAMVRRGLVRCWSCSAFMRPDIAAAYERMQAERPEVGFQPLPEHGSTDEDARAKETIVGDDDGFEMADVPGGLGDFELGASFTSAAPEERSGRRASAFTGKGRAKTGGESKPSGDVKPESASSSAEPTTVEDQPAEGKGSEKKEPRREKAETAKSDDTADALLQVALQEERESGRRGRRTATDPVRVEGGWMITCPCPAHVRIKIKEAHRGKTGKCPNPDCGSYFTVPANLPMGEKESEAEAAAQQIGGVPADPAEKAGPYTHWIREARLHVVKPAKAKRKPGGHEKEFQPADLGFAKTEGVAAISLAAKAGGFMGKPPKPEQVREEITAELKAGKPAQDLSSTAVFTFAPEKLGKMIVEYPPAHEHESTFAGIPVFGAGHIAVKLPPAGAEDEQHFVTLTLTQFRRLAQLLEGLYDVDQLGFGCPIPADDDVVHLVDHYSEETLRVLRNPTFHLADPAIELETVGYRCESCGLIVSEKIRKEKKIGGEEGKKLSTAKCPKCKGKFGKNPLYALETASADNEETPAIPNEESAEPAKAGEEK